MSILRGKNAQQEKDYWRLVHAPKVAAPLLVEMGHNFCKNNKGSKLMRVSPEIKIGKALDKIAALLTVISETSAKFSGNNVVSLKPAKKRKYKKSKKAKKAE